MHHIAPGWSPKLLPGKGLEPIRISDIPAGFLEQTILQVRELGFDIVDLDEIRGRFLEKDFGGRFVRFRLDDG